MIYCPVSEEAIYQELITAYNKQDSSLKIELSTYDVDEVSIEEIVQSKADILSIPSEVRTSGISPEEHFLELSARLDAERVLLSPEDEVYLLPLNGDIPLLLCNEQLLESQDLFVPETFSDFQNICLTLQQSEVKPFVFSSTDDRTIGAKMFSDGVFLNDMNRIGKIWDAEGELNMGFSDLVWLTYAFEEGESLYDESIENRETLIREFDNRNIAMMPVSSQEIQQQGTLPEHLKVVNIFGNSPYRLVPWISDLRAAIPKNAKNHAGAARFIVFLISDEAQRILYRQRGRLPIVRDVDVMDSLEPIYEVAIYSDGVRPSFFERLSESQESICLEEIGKIFDRNEDFQVLISRLEDRLLTEETILKGEGK